MLRTIIIAFSFATLLTACHRDPMSENQDDNIGKGGAITFKAKVANGITTKNNSQQIGIDLFTGTIQQLDDSQTKGTTTTGNINDGTAFGVLAYKSQGNNLTESYFYNKKVTYSAGEYLYDEPEYWPDVPLRFFAYSPYVSGENSDTAAIQLMPQSLANSPTINFSVDTHVAKQLDLLLASTPQLLYTPTVNLAFDHALTQVEFSFKKQNISATVTIDSITLQNVLSKGSVSLQKQPSGLYLWTPNNQSATTYVLTTDNGALLPADKQNITSEKFTEVTTIQGALLMIPQTITAGGYLLRIDYNIDGVTQFLEATLPEAAAGDLGSWESGRIVNYLITLTPEGSVEEVIIPAAEGYVNSFMLDPSPRLFDNTTHITFHLPIVRVNEFYDNPVYNWVVDPLTGISPTTQWGVEIIWMSRSDLLTLTKAKGTGPDDTFAVTTRTNSRGNALVGIFKDPNNNGLRDHNEPLLWSWHLWMTNYSPDNYLASSPINSSGDGRWETTVGAVFRYQDGNGGNTIYGAPQPWKPLSGLYAGGVMMDRNLGATTPDFPLLESSIPFEYANLEQRNRPLDVLYYQYGRKDPIPSDATRYQADGTPLPPLATITAPVSLKQILQNPQLIPVGPDSWTYDSPLIPTHWFDREAPAYNDKYIQHKSIYDPCPYGWQVPINATWSHYNTAKFSANSLTYNVANGTTAYPLVGYRHPLTAKVTQQGYQTYTWSDAPTTSNTAAYALFATSPNPNPFEPNQPLNTIQPSQQTPQTTATPIRCVKF